MLFRNLKRIKINVSSLLLKKKKIIKIAKHVSARYKITPELHFNEAKTK